MKRRILLACVAAVVAVGGVLLWLSRGPRFSDVKRQDARYDAIVRAVEEGYLEARADGSFGPDEAADGAAVLTALLRALGQAAEPLEEQAAAHRLVLSTQKFDLNAPVTRLTAAAMAARGLDLLSIAGESPYDDCADGYVVKLWEKNVWREEGGLFRPEAPLTRAELARAFNSLLGRCPDGQDAQLQAAAWYRDNQDQTAWYYADLIEASVDHTCRLLPQGEQWTAIG